MSRTATETSQTRARYAGGAARGLIGEIRDAHGAAATKVFGHARTVLGPAVTPLEVAHDAGLHAFYTAAGAAVGIAGHMVDPVATTAAKYGPTRTVVRRAQSLSAFVNGFTGDRLAESELPIAYPMTLRRSGYDVPLTEAGLKNAYPDAASSIIVFVHGFVGTEQMWKRRARRDDEGRRLSYGRRLESLGDWSALWVRYNTGQRISTGGRDLGRLLADVTRRWPVPVERIVLVGHSMGGLVVHSALLQATRRDRWLRLVSDTVTLGTPYHGALAEKGVNVLAKELAQHRATAWASGLLSHRSLGIKDLRHGNLVPADWTGFDPDDPLDHREARDPVHGIRHLAVAGVVSQDPKAWWGRLLGDLVVSRRSACGFVHDDWETLVIGAMNHMDLLNDPRVFNILAERLGVELLPLRHPRDEARAT